MHACLIAWYCCDYIGNGLGWWWYSAKRCADYTDTIYVDGRCDNGENGEHLGGDEWNEDSEDGDSLGVEE